MIHGITVVKKRSLHAQEMFHCDEMSTSHASCCCVLFLEIAFIADVQNHAQKFSLSKTTD